MNKKNVTLIGQNPSSDPIVIDGNEGDNFNAAKRKGIIIQNSSQNIDLDTLTIKNCYGPAILVKGSGHAFQNLVFDDNHETGIEFQGASNVVLDDCVADDTNVYASGTGDGFRVLNSSNITFENCTAKLNAKDGMRIENSSDIDLNDFQCHQNGRQGLKTETASDVTVDGGNFWFNSTAGIQIETSSSDCVIKNANVYDNNRSTTSRGEAGIWIDCSDDCLIQDCVIYGNTTGIRVSGDPNSSDNVIIRFNEIYDNAPPEPLAQQESGVDFRDSNKIAFYHNTIWDSGDSGSNRGFGSWESSSTQISFVNNIVGRSQGSLQVELSGGDQYRSFDNNVYYDPPGSMEYSVDSSSYSFTNYQDEMKTEYDLEYISKQSSSNPISDSTRIPVSSGDAHNKAMALSHVASKSGSTVTVGNAHFFRAGDSVRFSGNMTGTRTINSISGDVLTLTSSAPSGSTTDSFIWLNRSYNGSAPDIGAVER